MGPARSSVVWACLLASGSLCACGGGGGQVAPPPPPPPPAVTVSVTPASASVFLGATQQFTATVTGSANSAVMWSVNGVAGGNDAAGTITAGGLYTAPQNLPSPAAVTVTATSSADASKSASVTVTIQSDVAVAVAPGAPSVELGATQQFTAVVSGSGNPNRAVVWSVEGIAGGNATVGTISAAGLYTAPSILPAPATVSIAATSVADSTKSSTAMTTVTSNLSVAVSGPTTVNTGDSAQFTAVVTPAPMSNPHLGVTWLVDGIAGGNATVGTIDGSGLYTAPLVAPLTSTVTVTAASVADPAKRGAVPVTIHTFISVNVSPSPSVGVALEGSQQFTATVTGTLNQNVTWLVNGIPGGQQATVGAISNPGAAPATYFAPVNMPAPGTTITVTAASQEDPTKTASATVNLFSNIVVVATTLDGSAAAVRAVGRRETICASIGGTSNPAMQWQVDGVLNGNAAVGQMVPSTVQTSSCAVPGPPGSVSVTMDYVAPAAVPATNPLVVRVSSVADPARFAEILMTIVPAVTVSVTPASASVVPGGSQQFAAAVAGSPDTSVGWSVAGSGCNGMACGVISAGGLYTALATAPLLAVDTVTATATDGGATDTATVTIAAVVPAIRGLMPASASAGASAPFPVRVVGTNFTAASEVLINGAARATACPTSTECTATVLPGDVASAGSLALQIRDPGPPVALSNTVTLEAVAPVAAEEVIALSAAAPDAAAKDVAVVDVAAPAGSQNNLGLLGVLVNNSCSAVSGPVAIQRPTTGTTQVHLCAGGADFGQTFTLSGPNPADILITNVQPLNLGFVQVQITLSVPSTAQPGLRTLFAVDGNGNRSAASGAILVK